MLKIKLEFWRRYNAISVKLPAKILHATVMAHDYSVAVKRSSVLQCSEKYTREFFAKSRGCLSVVSYKPKKTGN